VFLDLVRRHLHGSEIFSSWCELICFGFALYEENQSASGWLRHALGSPHIQ
jgi:hypothetical protein